MFRFFSPTRILMLAVGVATFCCGPEQAQAQLLPTVNSLKTRRFEPAYQYSPADPWIRSKAIQLQTKDYGFFYNCDNEESKRNSPYIKWNSHCETDLPKKKCCLDFVKRELDEIKQRISDGSCGCREPGCNCQ